MENSSHDFIVVGGGIAGSVVASRLHECFPNLSILLVEAGPKVTEDSSGIETKPLVGSDLDWKYSTTPQQHLNQRVCSNNAGKVLGGGSVINNGGWIRGDARDYDNWADAVQDLRWSYKGLLPFFRKTENYHTSDTNPNEHGFQGPVHTQSVSSTGRNYPLREPLKAAWASAGVNHVVDANSGSPQGVGELIENRHNGRRQVASMVYSLAGIQIMTDSLVRRVLVEERETKKVAFGIQLADDRILTATKEIILSAGAYRTPQVLLLSGIGPANHLQALGIAQTVNAPHVGYNLHDHMAVAQWWKLRNPDAGLTLGSPKFDSPAFAKGTPLDWIVTQSVPRDGLKSALAKDLGEVDGSHSLLSPPRSHTETLIVYAAANDANPQIPMDGSHLTTTVINLLPTSRGTISLSSTDPANAPLIDPNYNATEADRYVMRAGIRKLLQMLLDTEEGKAIIESETVADGQSPLDLASSDRDLDARIRERGTTLYHPAGTAAMGKVVDTNLKVYGVQSLRVVDASVIPLPIAGHYQVCVYALAEQAVEIIAGDYDPAKDEEAAR